MQYGELWHPSCAAGLNAHANYGEKEREQDREEGQQSTQGKKEGTEGEVKSRKRLARDRRAAKTLWVLSTI